MRARRLGWPSGTSWDGVASGDRWAEVGSHSLVNETLGASRQPYKSKKTKKIGAGERFARPLALGFMLYTAWTVLTYLPEAATPCPASALPLPCLLLLLPSLAMALAGHVLSLSRSLLWSGEGLE